MAKRHAADIDVRTELLPSIVDYFAKTQPRTLYAEYPVSTLTYDEVYRKITYGDFSNAINGLAWCLYDNLGLGQSREVLAYIGPNDVRYPALVLDAVKAGYTVFLTSPRNSLAAQTSLFSHLKCKTILSPRPRPPPVASILDSLELRVVDIPSVDELLDKKHPHFTYARRFDEALQDPLWDNNNDIAGPSAWSQKPGQNDPRKEALYGIPSIPWCASIATLLFNAIPFGTVIIAPISGAIHSATGLVEGLRRTSGDIAFIVPSIVQELNQHPALLDYCVKNLEMIMYCGGDLPQAIGDEIGLKIKLINQFSASKLSIVPLLLSDDHNTKDWKYAQFRHVTGNEYELYVVSDSKLIETQPTFTIFPHLKEYGSWDLFVPHPSKPDLWAWHARADDIIVFLNGEKHNPISMEQYIVSRNPEISACLVVGAQRFQAALLIELATDKDDLSKANRNAPTHAWIYKTHILFTHPRKLMLRAGKGTVQRAGTLNLYAKEIDALYETANLISDGLEGSASGTISMDDMPGVLKLVKESILSVTNALDIGDNDNLFTAGFWHIDDYTKRSIYEYPSAVELTNAIVRLSTKFQISRDSEEHTQYELRSKMLEEYMDRINHISIPHMSPEGAHGHVVVLTGSTGALGSYLLNALLAEPTMTHIYCLNRVVNSSALQLERNRSRGLSTHINSDRVSFLFADLSLENLGLQPDAYSNLQDSVTLVIHNAWPVNFNLSLPSFRPQLDGLINLIKFTASAKYTPHLFFVSSISSVLLQHTVSHQIPEEVISIHSAPLANGYAESKVGQIAGAVKYAGLWNKAEWFPSLVISSIQVVTVPSSLGSMATVDWFPIDLFSEILVELVLDGDKRCRDAKGEEKGQISVYHPLNPHLTTWESVKVVLVDEIFSLTGKKMETVPLRRWVENVRKAMESMSSTQTDTKT
ncbi:MAG: hypothetical protein MMC33_006772 [Icmadophila ericetorum]|nr:hypothetical protein [Icmadophila ericetorum]